jgi:SAM-dependent methyltransferase
MNTELGGETMSIAKLTNGLTADENGVLISPEVKSLSYPEDGNLKSFQMEDGSFWFRHRNNCIISVIEQFPPKGAILDVGGGNGFVTRRMLDEGFDAALLEPGAIGALNGKTGRSIPEVICSTLEAAGFQEASLSAVGCFDVIEHIESDLAFVQLVHRLLKPGGMFYGTVPAHRWLWSLSDNNAGHYRRYDRKMVYDLLASEFDILYFTYSFGILTLAIFLFRTVPFRLRLSKVREALSSETEHGTSGGTAVAVFNHFLTKELGSIQKGKSRPIGTSCLFVAQKKSAQEVAPADADKPRR